MGREVDLGSIRIYTEVVDTPAGPRERSAIDCKDVWYGTPGDLTDEDIASFGLVVAAGVNSRWKLVEDHPLPDGRSVLCYIAKPRNGSQIVIRHSQKIMNGYMDIIDGLFGFDFSGKILAWREMDDLLEDLPLKLTEGDAHETDR